MAEDTLDTNVAGTRADLFKLVTLTGAMIIGTLGLYSFWARTRLRRWLWSSVRPGGMPLEYTGEPLEKLIGFFVAAVMLVFYVTLVMMGLMTLSLNVAGDPTLGALAGLMLLSPLYYIAQYRGRRYLLNHTAWRGLSFSMTPGAFGYMWRAFFYTALVFGSLGVLTPLKTFRLQKYMIDRTWFGDDRFFQDGSAWGLYRVFLPAWFAAVIGSGFLFFGIGAGQGTAIALGCFLLLAAMILWVYYRVASFRMMMSSVVFSAGVELDIYPRTGKVLRAVILGNLIVFLLLSIILPLLFFMLTVIFGSLGAGINPDILMSGELSLGSLLGLPEWVIIATPLLIYLGFFVMRAQFKHVFVTFPILRQAAETLVIAEASVISDTRKGTQKHMHDADGLSSFFDFGGSI